MRAMQFSVFVALPFLLAWCSLFSQVAAMNTLLLRVVLSTLVLHFPRPGVLPMLLSLLVLGENLTANIPISKV